MALKVRGIVKEFGSVQVLRSVAFDLAASERAGLVGVNGSGKSTLMGILAGRLQADEGSVTWVAGSPVISYLCQGGEWDPASPLSRQLPGVAPELLARCGLDENVLNRVPGELSGGQKTRAALARAFGRHPHVLLLDEPTNHLDADGLEWLEGMLVSYAGTLLVASHDRFFLDRVARRILELDQGAVRSYRGNYSDYARQKGEERKRAEAEYSRYLNEKKRLEEAIQRERRWAAAAHRTRVTRDGPKNARVFARVQAKAHARAEANMEKRLERIKKEKPFERRNIAIEMGGDRSKTAPNLIVAQDTGFTYDGCRWLFRGATWSVRRGDRVAVIGPNGSGKTTLAGLILGFMEPTEGTLYRAPVRFGHLAQEIQDLDPGRTALEEAQAANPERARQDVYDLLGCLLFRDAEALKPVAVLSAGERIRLGIARLLLRSPDVLVLDEPTNGLDIASRERLEEALDAYRGTMVVVSHDRYLLRRLSNVVISLTGGELRYFPGGYADYRAHVEQEAARDASERRLLLEARLARVSADLSSAAEGESARLTDEFMEIRRELRALEETSR